LEKISCKDSFGDLTWVPRKGQALKIAAGPDGSIWRLSASAVGGGGKQIYKWSGDNWK